MMDSFKRPSILEIEDWLKLNVTKYSEPKRVRLFNFLINWERFTGTFKLKLDDDEVKYWISFSTDQSGRVVFDMPMFHSPMGVPASYPAVEFTGRTRVAINRALELLIPRLLPLGKDQRTGVEITFSTPLEDRVVDRQLLVSMKKNLCSNLNQIEIRLDDVQNS